MPYKIIATGETFPENEVRARFPNTSLPATLAQADMDALGIEVVPAQPPTPEELAAQAAASALALQAEIVRRVQDRLDAFARTRNYDGILSACTYATSSVPKFRTEGQYCVDARDQTWATLYQLMADVAAGTAQAPTSYEDVQAILPVLTWPA